METKIVHARIEASTNEKVKYILSQVGMTPEEAIKIFYSQIVLNNGLPFDVKMPLRLMSEEELFAELDEGERSAEHKGWLSIGASWDKLEKKLSAEN